MASNATSLPARRKLVIVGDGACGKTTLLIVFARGKFTEVHIPTVFDSSVADIQLPDGRWVELGLWDTAGQEDYDRLRPLCYPDTRVLLLCFALNDRDSFENVSEKWLPEIAHYIPDVPRLLVGCKADLAAARAVSRMEGEAAARAMHAVAYVECSSKTGDGVHDVFLRAAAAAMAPLAASRRRVCFVL
ncbi:hypothetical protein AURDEDRAFT_114284 [Auricularia subglabra TFB-10046 SS5]|nr:hypothetical protein AURDEDRAFT_114284 [Auricularia subglabra TFB-10046 SS5]